MGARLTFRMRRKNLSLHHKFGSLGIMEAEFTEPSGVVVTSDSDIIVFGQDGRSKFQFCQVGGGDGQMCFPIREAVHTAGRLVVVECRVVRAVTFDQSGNLLRKFVCSDQLTFPSGVAVNGKQEIFNHAHRVKVFSYTGAYLRQIGGEGVTNFPVAVWLGEAGEALVADNHRGFKVTVFTQYGALLKAYESNTKYRHCFDVACMDGRSVVLASRDCAIHKYHFAEVRRAPANASPQCSPCRYDLMEQAAATLGLWNPRLAVMLPEGEDLNKWVAVNMVDVFNEFNNLYGTVTKFCTESSCGIKSACPKHTSTTVLTELSELDQLLSMVNFRIQDPVLLALQRTAPKRVSERIAWGDYVTAHEEKRVRPRATA
ncbi:hypothetical protein HPB48_017342 [Haemaphysalis longicornis]|uniref:Uncharacterized protein n=1 Tax=Haemaphysalis longicornis TaxID=44386 RepID=A0A9J6H1E9_HAELO|nr:hypothetical protein HPB48_017342 [Haemaphysalis longicornis]